MVAPDQADIYEPSNTWATVSSAQAYATANRTHNVRAAIAAEYQQTGRMLAFAGSSLVASLTGWKAARLQATFVSAYTNEIGAQEVAVRTELAGSIHNLAMAVLVATREQERQNYTSTV